MTNQDQYSFHGQRSDENVLVVVNQHTWLLMPIVLIWFVVAAAVGIVMWKFGASRFTSYSIGTLGILAILYSLYQWFLWTNGTYIVTSQRVIKIDQLGLFRRLISEAEIGRIQQITTEISGPIRTVLNFGTIKIQTSSNEGRIDLDDVPDPYNIQQLIVGVQRHGQEPPKSTPRLS